MNRTLRRIVIALAMLMLVGLPSVSAQAPDDLTRLRKELDALRERQTAIERELQELKALLRPRAPGPESLNVSVRIDGSPFKGNPDAPLTLVEFSDYQCPFCGRHFRETLPQIEREYIQTGKVKYVFRNFPLESIHKDAFKAAEAAHCAGEEGKYWPMHDRLFGNQNALGLDDLRKHGEAVALGAEIFQRCLASGREAARIRADMVDATTVGVTGTPTFFVGVTVPNRSEITAVRAIRGAMPFATFKGVIDGLLAKPRD